jgi:hypothetical protein
LYIIYADAKNETIQEFGLGTRYWGFRIRDLKKILSVKNQSD